MQIQSTINKLPEVIKCIIFDYVNSMLNYNIEKSSDKFIGNPIDLFKCRIISDSSYYHTNSSYYHTNKLTKVKTSLHFIGLHYYCYNNQLPPPQEILNKLQKMSTYDNYMPNLPCIKNLYILDGKFTKIPNYVGLLKLCCKHCYNLTKIPNIVGLLELDCSGCINLTKIPNIKGLKKLNCQDCHKLIEIPHIKGLLELDCYNCHELIEIPHIIGLLELYCGLIIIPNIEGLKIN